MKIEVGREQEEIMNVMANAWEGRYTTDVLDDISIRLRNSGLSMEDINNAFASAVEYNRLKQTGSRDVETTRSLAAIFKSAVNNMAYDLQFLDGVDEVKIPDSIAVENPDQEYWDNIDSACQAAIQFEQEMEALEADIDSYYSLDAFGSDMVYSDEVIESDLSEQVVPEQEASEQAASEQITPDQELSENAPKAQEDPVEKTVVREEKPLPHAKQDGATEMGNAEETVPKKDIEQQKNESIMKKVYREACEASDQAQKTGATGTYAQDSREQANVLFENGMKINKNLSDISDRDLEGIASRGIINRCVRLFARALQELKQSIHDGIKCGDVQRETKALARSEMQERRIRRTLAAGYGKMQVLLDKQNAALEKSMERDHEKAQTRQESDQKRLRIRNALNVLRGKDIEEAGLRVRPGLRTKAIQRKIKNIRDQMGKMRMDYDASKKRSQQRSILINAKRSLNRMRESALPKVILSRTGNLSIESEEAKTEGKYAGNRFGNINKEARQYRKAENERKQEEKHSRIGEENPERDDVYIPERFIDVDAWCFARNGSDPVAIEVPGHEGAYVYVTSDQVSRTRRGEIHVHFLSEELEAKKWVQDRIGPDGPVGHMETFRLSVDDLLELCLEEMQKETMQRNKTDAPREKEPVQEENRSESPSGQRTDEGAEKKPAGKEEPKEKESISFTAPQKNTRFFASKEGQSLCEISVPSEGKGKWPTFVVDASCTEKLPNGRTKLTLPAEGMTRLTRYQDTGETDHDGKKLYKRDKTPVSNRELAGMVDRYFGKDKDRADAPASATGKSFAERTGKAMQDAEEHRKEQGTSRSGNKGDTAR